LYKNLGDIRILDDCLNKYEYNIIEINQVINMYEDPEVEHIAILVKKQWTKLKKYVQKHSNIIKK
jgi:hypothetical protein